ncbi:MAG: hypothetical protein BAJALOKI2v1_290007 [Promethearchaeota archaeon]|nr:MAG: hypothetical protein BAJALOKI2v1_290007 [Candidatus Lokiarchaeota archaeon]
MVSLGEIKLIYFGNFSPLGMSDNKRPEKVKEKEVEELLDKVWENWASRRKCEQTHRPNYLKREKHIEKED